VRVVSTLRIRGLGGVRGGASGGAYSDGRVKNNAKLSLYRTGQALRLRLPEF
jgi:hypothetical protein